MRHRNVVTMYIGIAGGFGVRLKVPEIDGLVAGDFALGVPVCVRVFCRERGFREKRVAYPQERHPGTSILR
jgi:hypothetical protein